MSNVTVLNSPEALLTYLNAVVIPAVFDVIDKGGHYTVIEETPFLVTTVFSEDALEAHLDALAGTLVNVVPKREGGFFTFVSETNEAFGPDNGFQMLIASSPGDLENILNSVAQKHVFEHGNKTIVIF